jgi:membrane-associated protease RseP (regulator of RpoE activity)
VIERTEHIEAGSMPHPFLVLAALAAVCQIVHLVGRLLVSWLVGAKVEEIVLFIGPGLRFRLGGIDYKIGLIPLGSSVRFPNEDKDPDRFSALPLWKRLAVFASGVVALAILACLCLGPWQGVLSIWRGLDQVLIGACSPMRTGRTLIRTLYAILRVDPYVIGLGIVAAKTVAVNIYPIPSLDGGSIVLALLERAFGLSDKAREWMTILGLVFFLILVASWVFAFVGEAVSS